LQERAATFVVAGILGLTSHTAGDQPRHDLAEGGHDRPELAAKADRGTAIRPSAGDRVVVEASAPDDDPSPGQRLDEWEEKYVGEFLTSVAEDQEKRKDES
jgi:hypothetical protein